MDTGETAASASPVASNVLPALLSGPSAAAASALPAIKRGTRVRLDGLVSATHLNKQIGFVTTPPSSFTHRYNVIMEETGEIVLVLFEKLKMCVPARAARRRSIPGQLCPRPRDIPLYISLHLCLPPFAHPFREETGDDDDDQDFEARSACLLKRLGITRFLDGTVVSVRVPEGHPPPRLGRPFCPRTHSHAPPPAPLQDSTNPNKDDTINDPKQPSVSLLASLAPVVFETIDGAEVGRARFLFPRFLP